MKDREFLIWIHQRLIYTHKENRLLDYMHRLRKIIQATPAHQDSSPMSSSNSIANIHLPHVTKEEEIEVEAEKLQLKKEYDELFKTKTQTG